MGSLSTGLSSGYILLLPKSISTPFPSWVSCAPTHVQFWDIVNQHSPLKSLMGQIPKKHFAWAPSLGASQVSTRKLRHAEGSMMAHIRHNAHQQEKTETQGGYKQISWKGFIQEGSRIFLWHIPHFHEFRKALQFCLHPLSILAFLLSDPIPCRARSSTELSQPARAFGKVGNSNRPPQGRKFD